MYDGTAGSVRVFHWSLPTSQQIAGRSLHVGAPPGRNVVGGSINEALPDSACSTVTVARPNSPSTWAGSRPPSNDD